MTQIKTYDDFIKIRHDEALWKALWEARQSADRDNKINEIMKDHVLAPDFDKKRLLACRLKPHESMMGDNYWFIETLLENTLAQYKKKSDKLNFVEDCLRDFGENNAEEEIGCLCLIFMIQSAGME